MNPRKVKNAVIANDETKSSAVETGVDASVVAIVTPSSLTGTSFTFEGSVDGSTYVPLYNEGTSYSVDVGTSRYVALDPAVLCGLQFIKIVSGSSEAAERTIQVVLRDVA
jgi:hypothetical protein